MHLDNNFYWIRQELKKCKSSFVCPFQDYLHLLGLNYLRDQVVLRSLSSVSLLNQIVRVDKHCKVLVSCSEKVMKIIIMLIKSKKQKYNLTIYYFSKLVNYYINITLLHYMYNYYTKITIIV